MKTAQAFRPHVMDMFEPQDHPNDFPYPGGPPIPPYDIAGWTLALQMGVEFDRILDGFDGPFVYARWPAARAAGSDSRSRQSGRLPDQPSHQQFLRRDQSPAQSRLPGVLASRSTSADGEDLGTGAIWVPESPAAREILEQVASKYGISAHGVADGARRASPQAEAHSHRPLRSVRRLDPFRLDPLAFRAVRVSVRGGVSADARRRRSEEPVRCARVSRCRLGRRRATGPETIPEKYRPWLGHIPKRRRRRSSRNSCKVAGRS